VPFNSSAGLLLDSSPAHPPSPASAASPPALELSQELYTSGLGDFLAVLDAERQLYGDEDLLAQSQTAVTTNLIALYKALGGGWESFPQQ
jgi:outer membrane protein TolC